MEASTIIDFQKVLSNWYMAMVELDMPLAHKQKEEADFLMQHMSTDEKTKTYYRLIDFRYRVMTEASLQAPSQQTGVFQDSIDETDQILRYLYAYMEGQYEYYSGRYKRAIHFFLIAEKHLDCVKDEEKGEFFQRVGEAYYRINQYTIALAYLEKSICLYEKFRMNYRIVSSLIFTGAIHSELYLFKDAERYYDRCLEVSQHKPEGIQSLVFRAIALHRIREKRFEEAIALLEKALPKHDLKIISIKTKCNLANLYFRIGRGDIGTDWLEESEKLANDYGLTEYIARCMSTRGLYVERNKEKVNDAIEMLKVNELFFEATEVCEENADFYEQKNRFELAYEYMKQANTFRINHQTVGVD
ncbi:hypothetical protein [Geomicrobium sp. JCM 19039]|uniref:response regulator aspartate phosphatase n=1 Tax=Geomicrobium sp. JCM 19039 TaxID=1460636 RepID=UPI00045F38AC|nr:hypothetical protein [Geomicrobium sp. JCM 19039]GAK13948.1 response regulator aspartate phosphatase [Geomicrobium sp. JCM 19039]